MMLSGRKIFWVHDEHDGYIKITMVFEYYFELLITGRLDYLSKSEINPVPGNSS
jgi:hypothetical protein